MEPKTSLFKRYRRGIVIAVVAVCLAGLGIASWVIASKRRANSIVVGPVVQAVGNMIVLRTNDKPRQFLVTNNTQVRDVTNGPARQASAGLLMPVGTMVYVVASMPSADVSGMEELVQADVLYSPPAVEADTDETEAQP